jgi:hypothetical protein
VVPDALASRTVLQRRRALPSTARRARVSPRQAVLLAAATARIESAAHSRDSPWRKLCSAVAAAPRCWRTRWSGNSASSTNDRRCSAAMSPVFALELEPPVSAPVSFLAQAVRTAVFRRALREAPYRPCRFRCTPNLCGRPWVHNYTFCRAETCRRCCRGCFARRRTRTTTT